MPKFIKCIYCSKEVDILPKGTVAPHIVHARKQCVGSGLRAVQMKRIRLVKDNLAQKDRATASLLAKFKAL